MSNKKIFISRSLTESTSLVQYCESKDLVIHAESLLHFELVPFDSIPESQWLFFYSKNAIQFFLRQLDSVDTINGIKIACFGPSTAQYFVEKTKIEVDFIGSGDPGEVALHFTQKLYNEKVLFIQATQSRRSIQKNWDTKHNYEELVVYDNQIKPSIDLFRGFDIAILTSPLNAKAFLDHAHHNDQIIITLGKTTSEFISSSYQISTYQPKQPSLESIITLLDQILKES